MQPVLFSIAGVSVPAFFFMVMIATLVGTYIATKMAEKKGLEPVIILDLGIFGIIAGVLGSRIFHILVEAPAYYWEDPIRVFYFWQGGFVSLGAYIGAGLSWLVYLKVRKKSVLDYINNTVFAVPVVIFFVRLGCLLNGCCYGKPTDFFVHLIFTNPASTAAHYYPGIPLHATQFYNMLNAIVLWAIMWVIHKKVKMKGKFLVTFFLYYGFSRFMIEFLRGDTDRGMWFGGNISSGQIVMSGFFIFGLILFFLFKGKKEGAN
ncbi:prolipoprotein diacylglyceryl transferase [bacterium]|nr:prolipoprotein diacylglyceryl transferase [bacterium]